MFCGNLPDKSLLFCYHIVRRSVIAAPYADSMTVQDGRITWIGQKADLPDTEGTVTDLGGKRVIPGFVDAHMHPVMLADFRKRITVMPPEINSIEELVSAIRRRREDQGPGEWIEGWGYDEQGLLEKRSPTRYDLDRGCSDAPVSMMRTCAHIRCVNSMALKLAGIDRNTPDPPGGEIERDENGEPTGVLKENARNLIDSVEKKTENLLELGELLTSQGITAICDMGNLDSSDNFPIYEAAARRGFHQRVGIYYMWDYFADDDTFTIPAERLDRSRQIFAAGLKLIGDGSISGRTAWMDRPYYGRAGLPTAFHMSGSSMSQILRRTASRRPLHTGSHLSPSRSSCMQKAQATSKILVKSG